MAILYIDTSDTEKIIVEIDGLRVESESHQEKAQKLLEVISQALTKKKIDLHDLTRVKVNTGPGSFTGLRVGISVANTLGWSLGIPVNGKNVIKDGPVEPIYS